MMFDETSALGELVQEVLLVMEQFEKGMISGR